MATLIRNGRGVHGGIGLQVLGDRGLRICLLLAMIMVIDVHFITPASAQSPALAPLQELKQKIPIFHQFEADALNDIFTYWNTLNRQFSEVLKWATTNKHPCDSSNLDFSSEPNYALNVGYEGSWVGVYCTPTYLMTNETGDYYAVNVTTIMLYGSDSRCNWDHNDQCGFSGIKGGLPSSISRLIYLKNIWIDHHPELTGPVPLEIWQMPNLVDVALQDNSLSGPLPSNVISASSKLGGIYLNQNKFSGRLEVSPHGTLFSSTLKNLNLSHNQLEGELDFRGLNSSNSISAFDLSNNKLNGTFSIGPYFDPGFLFISDNELTHIRFENYSGLKPRPAGTVYMPSLINLKASNNRLSGPFPAETLHMPKLEFLDLRGNNLTGTLDSLHKIRVSNDTPLANMKSLDLSRNKFYGSMDFRDIILMPKLRYLYINENNFSGTFFTGPNLTLWEMDISKNYFDKVTFDFYNGSFENGHMPFLKTLDISNNTMSGEFPSYLLKVPSLQYLYSGQNRFSTLQLPEILSENSSLLILSLTHNDINTITYPETGLLSISNLQIANLLFLSGNPMCKKIKNVLLSSICRLNQTSLLLAVESMSNTKSKVIIATSTSTIFFIALLVTTLYVWRLMSRIKSLNIILGEFEKKEVKPNLYSYKDIKLATNYFDKKNKLGEGGFGIVYKGELSDGTLVAVKKLTMSSGQVLSEFLNEVVVISGLKHRNLVKLKGCCLGDGNQRMLVFEYVENKNLAEALLIEGDETHNFDSPYLDWKTRFNIIIGFARGLAYLHEDLQSPIIHRDLKASNILLDKNYNPKIADFGLAFLFPNLGNKETHLTMLQVAGTRGYLSPEYAIHGHISTALDVYSFGIVVLEIVTGRKSIDFQKSSEEIYLREWAWRQFQVQASMTLIDPNMKYSPMDTEAIARVISVALACAHFKVAKRPRMQDVVPMLVGNMPINDFCEDFEFGEPVEDGTSNFSGTSTSTSSLWMKDKHKRDERSLLNNISDIEMN